MNLYSNMIVLVWRRLVLSAQACSHVWINHLAYYSHVHLSPTSQRVTKHMQTMQQLNMGTCWAHTMKNNVSAVNMKAMCMLQLPWNQKKKHDFQNLCQLRFHWHACALTCHTQQIRDGPQNWTPLYTGLREVQTLKRWKFGRQILLAFRMASNSACIAESETGGKMGLAILSESSYLARIRLF